MTNLPGIGRVPTPVSFDDLRRSAEAVRALNDPTVECCGRDAADCDCSTLQKLRLAAQLPTTNSKESMLKLASLTLLVQSLVDSCCDTCDRDVLETEACPNLKTTCVDCCGEDH